MKTTRILVATMMALMAFAAGAQTSYDQGVQAFEQRNYDMARSYFNKAVETGNEAALANAYLGIIDCRQEKYKDAADKLMTAEHDLSGNGNQEFMGVLYYHMGMAQAACGDTISAVNAMAQAAAADPQKALYAQECGIMLQNTKRYDEALPMLKRAAQLDPADAFTQAGLGYTYIGLKQRDNAIAAFRQAARLDADNAEHYEGIATALAEFGPDMSITGEVTERDITDEDEVTLPSFPGGIKALKQVVAQSVKLPEGAREKDAEGTVVVDCLIDTTGKVIQTKLVSPVSALLDDEAMRVCAQLSGFTPATRNGEPVQSWVQVPVEFKLP